MVHPSIKKAYELLGEPVPDDIVEPDALLEWQRLQPQPLKPSSHKSVEQLPRQQLDAWFNERFTDRIGKCLEEFAGIVGEENMRHFTQFAEVLGEEMGAMVDRERRALEKQIAHLENQVTQLRTDLEGLRTAKHGNTADIIKLKGTAGGSAA